MVILGGGESRRNALLARRTCFVRNRLRQRAVAVLVFLAGTAWAGLVAPHLGVNGVALPRGVRGRAHQGRHRSRLLGGEGRRSQRWRGVTLEYAARISG